jgi:predicted alpha/beta-fold hydrolase
MAEGVYNKGFDVVVLHARGCGRSLITTPELFSGFSTDEIRFFLKQLRADYPNRPFYGVGFSFGASLLSTYLGEEGENSEYTACVALSNPWSLVDSCYRLGFCFWPRVLFLKPITQTLVRLVKSNQKELLKNELITEEKINAHYTSPHHFDSVFTAPLNGFNSALEYYRGASSINKIFKIRTPLLVINSYDDPVVGINSIPTYEAEINPSIVCLRTDLGGHIAYVRPDGSLWAIDKIAEFFEAFQNTVDTSQKIKSDFKHKISRYHDRLTH